MHEDYFVTATNSIFRTLSHDLTPTLPELREAFVVGCNALIRVQEEGAFLKAVNLLSQRVPAAKRDAEEIVTNIEHFMTHFLVIEESVMVAGGINQVTWARLSALAKDVRAEVTLGILDGERLLRIVRELRIVTCKIASQLETAVHGSEDWKRAARLLLKLGAGLGGATMIFVNAGGAAATLGLSAAGSVVSGILGGALLTESLEGASK